MQIIGLSGTKRSGKDTVCRLMQEITRKGRLKREAFADNLKQEVADMLRVKVEMIEQDKERFRPMLQWYGADYCRHYFGKSYWIDQMFDKVRYNFENEQITVITDVRYPNEAHFVRSRGVLVNVQRNTGLQDSHSSENALKDFDSYDYTINNNEGLEELKEKVQKLFCEIDAIA